MDKLIKLPNGSSILLSQIGAVLIFKTGISIQSKEKYAVYSDCYSEENASRIVAQINDDLEEYLACINTPRIAYDAKPKL